MSEVEPSILAKLTVGKLPVLVENLSKTIQGNLQLSLQEKQSLAEQVSQIGTEIRSLSDRLKSVFEIDADQLIREIEDTTPQYIPSPPNEYLQDPLVRSFFESVDLSSENLTLENLETLAVKSRCPDLQVEIIKSSFPKADSINPEDIEIESYKCPSQSPYWTVRLNWRDKTLQAQKLEDSAKNLIISEILTAVDTYASLPPKRNTSMDSLLPADRSAEEYSLALEKSAFRFLIQ